MAAESTRGELIDKVDQDPALRRRGQGRPPLQLRGHGRRRRRQGQGRLGLRQGQRSAAHRREGRQGRQPQHDRSAPIENGTIPHTVKGTYGSAQRDADARRARHGRDRRRRGAGRVRSGRHQRHSHQELRLDQSDQPGQGHARRPAATADRSKRSSGCGECRCHESATTSIAAFKSTRSASRIGRGTGSGHGKTAGRGHKGQGQLAGWTMHPAFEGGQMPLVRRVPKRGFNNRWGRSVGVVNVGDLDEAVQDRRRGHSGVAAGEEPVSRARSTC